MDDVRKLLRDKADEMPVRLDLPPGLRRRSRWRRIGTSLVTFMIVLGLGAGSYAGIQAVLDRQGRGTLLPAEPPGMDEPGGTITFEQVTWIYPENPGQVQEDLVEQGQDQFWLDPAQVGLAFAEDVLGWEREEIETSVRSGDPVRVVIANPTLAQTNGIPSDLSIALEMERWTDDGIYYVKRATSGLLSLSSPPSEIELPSLSSRKDAQPPDFLSGLDFSGELSFVPEDSTIAVLVQSGETAKAEAPATARFDLTAKGVLSTERRPIVVASASLRSSAGSTLAYTAYPVVFTIPPEDQVIAPCERGGPSAPGADFQEHPPVPFPEAVGDTRGALMAAARDRDWIAIEELIPESGFTFSFGGDRDPIAFWKELEASGTPVLDILHTLMCWTGSEYQGVFIFPQAAEIPPSEWTEGDMAPLREIYSEEELEQIRSQDSYYGWRVGIEPDGTWVFFVAGD